MDHSLIGRILLFAWLALAPAPGAPPAAARAALPHVTGTLTLPLREGSVRFGVVGDVGADARGRADVARQLAAFHAEFPFDFSPSDYDVLVFCGLEVFPDSIDAGISDERLAAERTILQRLLGEGPRAVVLTSSAGVYAKPAAPGLLAESAALDAGTRHGRHEIALVLVQVKVLNELVRRSQSLRYDPPGQPAAESLRPMESDVAALQQVLQPNP